jgi:hypothetical protein
MAPTTASPSPEAAVVVPLSRPISRKVRIKSLFKIDQIALPHPNHSLF